MPEFNIRPALRADIHSILELITDLARYEKAEHEVVATEPMLKESLFGDTPSAHALMVDVDGRSIGFALYFFSYSTWLGKPGLYLEDLYVDPAFREQGIGKAVLKRLAQIALARNCGRFEWSVLDWNEPSIKFYEALGARAQSEWIKYRLSGKALTELAAPD